MPSASFRPLFPEKKRKKKYKQANAKKKKRRETHIFTPGWHLLILSLCNAVTAGELKVFILDGSFCVSLNHLLFSRPWLCKPVNIPL